MKSNTIILFEKNNTKWVHPQDIILTMHNNQTISNNINTHFVKYLYIEYFVNVILRKMLKPHLNIFV
jgi:hypothetical protein